MIGKPPQALQDGWLSVELLLWYVENPAVLGVWERFSNECRKTNTEAIKIASAGIARKISPGTNEFFK